MKQMMHFASFIPEASQVIVSAELLSLVFAIWWRLHCIFTKLACNAKDDQLMGSQQWATTTDQSMPKASLSRYLARPVLTRVCLVTHLMTHGPHGLC